MYFYPWSSSSFPISSETGQALTSIPLPGLTIATPQINCGFSEPSFYLKYSALPPTKTGPKSPATSKSCMHRDPDSSVNRVQTLFRQPLDQSGKTGKTFALFAHSSKSKIPSSSQHKFKFYNPRY